MVNLHPMTETEFEAFKTFIIEDYAQNIARNYLKPIEDAREGSAKQINAMLKEGISTPNHYIYNVVPAGEETILGYLWVEVNESKHSCFICEIRLLEAHRGKGWGTKTLQTLEKMVKEKGVTSIGLHVFGDNPIARRLYEKIGYQVTGMNMQKWLED